MGCATIQVILAKSLSGEEFDLNLNRVTGSMAPDSRKRLSVGQPGAPPEIGGDNERRCQ